MSTILDHFGVAKQPEKADKENEEPMGIQSQHRKPSAQRIRERRPHQLKSKQNSQQEEEKEEFNPAVDCAVCRAKATNSTVPHRKHHDQCPQKRKEKGQLDLDQPTLGQALAEHEKGRVIESQDQLDKFFAPRQSLFPSTKGSMTGSESTGIRPFTADEWRDMVDNKIREYGQMKPAAVSSTTKEPPLPVKAVVDIVLERLPTNFSAKSNELPTTDLALKAIEWFKQQFGASLCITLPSQSLHKAPSPYYSSIEGTRVYFIRWELLYPSIYLKCTRPGCEQIVPTIPTMQIGPPSVSHPMLSTLQQFPLAVPVPFMMTAPYLVPMHVFQQSMPARSRPKPQTDYCCPKYFEYKSGPPKPGRPPHDDSCPRNKK